MDINRNFHLGMAFDRGSGKEFGMGFGKNSGKVEIMAARLSDCIM